MLMDLETLDWDDELLGIFDIPRSMLPTITPSSTADGLRQDPQGRAVRRRDPDHRRPRRPAGGHRRPGVLRARRGEEHLRHRQLHAAQHRHRARPLERGPADHGLLQVRRRGRGLRPRGLDRGDRLGGAVAARPAGDHQRRLGERVAGPAGRGQRRRLLRAGVLRAVRAVLAQRRPRRDRRAVAVQHQRAPGPGDAGGDLLPEPRRRRGDGEGLRGHARGAEGRRRRHRERPVHADPGRHPRRPGEPAGGRRDDRARRRVRGRAGGRLLEQHRRAARELERSRSAGSRPGARSSAKTGTPAGRRPSSGRWTGWTSTEPAPDVRPRTAAWKRSRR